MKHAATVVTVWALYTSSLLAQSSSPPKEPDPPLVATGPASEARALPSVSSVFRDLARDVRRLASLETAVVLGGAGAVSFGVRNHDRTITAHAASSATLDRVFESGEVFGDGAVQAGAAFATYAVGRIVSSPKAATVGADLLRGQILNAVLTQGLKLSVRRVRPDGGKYSFPSGHSSSSFAFATVLGRHFGWKVGVPAYTLAATVAASRLQENRHFLTDVAFGAALGLVTGRTVTIGRRPARFVVSPVASAGLAGVAFTWVAAP
jgi:hypothetical protein